MEPVQAANPVWRAAVLPRFVLCAKQLYALIPDRVLVAYFRRPIDRCVVDNHDLVDVRKILEDPMENAFDRSLFVIGWYNQTQQMVVHRRWIGSSQTD